MVRRWTDRHHREEAAEATRREEQSARRPDHEAPTDGKRAAWSEEALGRWPSARTWRSAMSNHVTQSTAGPPPYPQRPLSAGYRYQDLLAAIVGAQILFRGT